MLKKASENTVVGLLGVDFFSATGSLGLSGSSKPTSPNLVCTSPNLVFGSPERNINFLQCI